MKQVLAIFLIAAMLFSLVPSGGIAFADDASLQVESAELGASEPIERKAEGTLESEITKSEKEETSRDGEFLLSDAANSLTSKVTFDAGDARHFEASVVEVKKGSPVTEPKRKPFKKGYKFLHWTLNGEPYNFQEAVSGDITLKAEFQVLERKNGNGFEVYVVDAVTRTRVSIPTEVVLNMSTLEKPSFEETRYYYSVQPRIEEIVFGIKGRKYLGIKEYKVDVQGHYTTIGTKLNEYIPVKAREEFRRDLEKEGPQYGFSVSVASDENTEMGGPHFGQVEGGIIEIVVNTEADDTQKVSLYLDDGLFFQTNQLEYYVKSGEKFARPAEEPLKKGFRFLGWFNGDVEYDFEQEVTGPLALTARYEEIPNLGQVVLHLELPDGSVVPMPNVVLEHKETDYPSFYSIGHSYSASIAHHAIQEAIGKSWVFGGVKDKKLEMKGRRSVGIKINVNPSSVELKSDGSKINLDFNFMIHAVKGQVEGGVLTLVLEAERKQSFVVTFDPNQSMHFEATTVETKAGHPVSEPKRKPFKEGYKFLYWSLNGKQYVFSEAVADDITLKAEFQALEQKNGNGFEVYVVDAVTNNRVAIQTEVTRYMDSIPEGTMFEELRRHFLINPTIEEIKLAISGRKYKGIKDYKVTVDGHFGTRGSSLDSVIPTLEAKKEFRRDADPNGPIYGFSVTVARAKDSEFFGPQFGQIEGGIIEIVVDTEDNLAHLVKLEVGDGHFFQTKQYQYYVDHGQTFARPKEEPLKKGSRFLGWFNGDVKYDFDQKVTEPLTLTARYEEIPNLGQVVLELALPDGSVVVMPNIAFEHKSFENSSANTTMHTYLLQLKNETIQDAIGKYWTLNSVKEYRIEMMGRAGIGTKVSSFAPFEKFETDVDKTFLEFSVLINTEKGQVEGGIVTLVLLATKNQSNPEQQPEKENRGDSSSNLGTADSETNYFPNTSTGTVEIEKEETPLSNPDKSSNVSINGIPVALTLEKDGTIVVTEEAVKEIKNPIVLSISFDHAAQRYVTFKKTDGSEKILPIALYFDGKMHVAMEGLGTYRVMEASDLTSVPETDWAAQSIRTIHANRIMIGNEQGDFMPKMSTTRAMFTQILARLQQVDLNQVRASSYEDVPTDSWYTASINWATEQGIVNGIGERKFAPELPISREELAVMIYRYMRLNNWNLSTKTETPQFADFEQVSEWAQEAVTALKDTGLFAGKPGNVFDPKASATRAEVATVIVRMLEMYLKSLAK